MSLQQVHYQTFKSGSKTYFNSSLFFPRAARQDVFALYGFVRVADNFVDSVPQDPEGFHRFAAETYAGGLFMIGSGGLLFAAVYMVTDPVSTPLTPKGMWWFGIGTGLLDLLGVANPSARCGAVERADELLDMAGIIHLRDHPAKTLSGGQKALLQMARGFMVDHIMI